MNRLGADQRARWYKIGDNNGCHHNGKADIFGHSIRTKSATQILIQRQLNEEATEEDNRQIEPMTSSDGVGRPYKSSPEELKIDGSGRRLFTSGWKMIID